MSESRRERLLDQEQRLGVLAAGKMEVDAPVGALAHDGRGHQQWECFAHFPGANG